MVEMRVRLLQQQADARFGWSDEEVARDLASHAFFLRTFYPRETERLKLEDMLLQQPPQQQAQLIVVPSQVNNGNGGDSGSAALQQQSADASSAAQQQVQSESNQAD